MAEGLFSLTQEEHLQMEVLRKMFAPTKEDLRMASNVKPIGKLGKTVPPQKQKKGC